MRKAVIFVAIIIIFSITNVAKAETIDCLWSNIDKISQTGAKAKSFLLSLPNSWGNINLGVWVNHYEYSKNNEPNEENRIVAFLQWPFG